MSEETDYHGRPWRGDKELQMVVASTILQLLRRIHPVDGGASLESVLVNYLGEIAPSEKDAQEGLNSMVNDMRDGIKQYFEMKRASEH